MFQGRQRIENGKAGWLQTDSCGDGIIWKPSEPMEVHYKDSNLDSSRLSPRRKLTINTQNMAGVLPQTWLSMKVHNKKEKLCGWSMSVWVFLDIRKICSREKVISVMNVESLSEFTPCQTSENPSWWEALSVARSVEKSLARMQAFWTSQSIPERNLIYVSTVENFGAAPTLIGTPENSVRRSPCQCKEWKTLVRPFSSPTIRESTATPKATSVMSVGKPSVWPLRPYSTPQDSHWEPSNVLFARKPSD